MWKPIGFLSTMGLLVISLLALALAAWFYDKADFNTVYDNSDALDPYINALRAILAVDLIAFIVSFIGVFLLVKPSAGGAKFYCVLIVLVVVFKIVAGAIWYSGVDDNGKNYNTVLDNWWTICDKYSSCSDGMKSWHTQRGMEIASIILFTLLGLFSAMSVLKVSGSS